MEMQKAALFGGLWEESSEDFRTEIFSRLPVELVYTYRMICKQWKDFLASNYFLTKWGEVQAPLNSKQPRLVLLNTNHRLSSASFCFYRWTWIKSSLSLSFLEDCVQKSCTICSEKGIYCKESVAGLMFVSAFHACNRRICGKLCNPYTRTFIDIPAPQSSHFCDCLVVNKERSTNGTSYKIKVIGVGNALGANGVFERHMVEIYEPSQKRWNIGGYFPEDLRLIPFAEVVFYNGSFYTYGQKDIVCFSIPLEENGLAVVPNPIPIPITIPMRFVPFPAIVENENEIVVSSPQMIKCGSRLLLIAAKAMPVNGEGEGELEMEVVIIVWELKEWESVEIARMPSFLCREWLTQQFISFYEYDIIHNWDNILWNCCIGVGDHLCFVPELVISSPVVKVVVYNLIDNTWDWLPRCPKSYFCNGKEDATYSKLYKPIALEPSPHIQVK